MIAELDQRHKNYVEYYEKVEPTKRYSLAELMAKNVTNLLKLMPNNLAVDEYSERLGFHTIKHICGFQMHKVIDDSWHIGYYENNRNNVQKDQHVLFEITHVKDLKIGLIDLFLMTQNYAQEHMNGIKSGRIRLSLGDSWDDRVKLHLEK